MIQRPEKTLARRLTCLVSKAEGLIEDIDRRHPELRDNDLIDHLFELVGHIAGRVEDQAEAEAEPPYLTFTIIGEEK